MGKLIIGFLAGLVLGGGGAMVLGGGLAGSAMGAGVATGLSTGICSIVEAAGQTGLMTPEQIQQVLTKAAENMQALSDENLPQATGAAGSVAECEAFMAELRAGRS